MLKPILSATAVAFAFSLATSTSSLADVSLENKAAGIDRLGRSIDASTQRRHRANRGGQRSRGRVAGSNRNRVVVRDPGPRVVVRKKRSRRVLRDRGPRRIYRDRGPRIVIGAPRRYYNDYYYRPHYGPRICTARRALRKARNLGIRRARVVRTNRRVVVVRGFRRGGPVRAKFERYGRFCPTIAVRRVGPRFF